MSDLQSRLRIQALPTWLVDAGLTVLFTFIGLVQLFGGPRRPFERVELMEQGLIILAGIALLFRGKYPVGTLAATGSIAFVYVIFRNPWPAILPLVLLALYYAVVNSRWSRWEILSFAVGVVVFIAIGLYVSDFRRAFNLGIWFNDFVWVVFAILLGDSMRSRREAAQEAQLRAEQAELTREEEARRRVSEERIDIARELHDIVAHNLALINVQAGVAAHVMDQNPEQAREAFKNIKMASHATLQELRALLKVLREPSAGTASYTPTVGLEGLDQLIAGIRDAGVEVEVEKDTRHGNLPATVDLAAYRILQEALTNVVKHADRSKVKIDIEQDSDRLAIKVRNDSGAGSTAAGAGTGSGITGMRERAAALGGTLEAGPLPDGGFRIEAVLPVTAA